MEQDNSQITIDVAAEETAPAKKSRKNLAIIISIFVAVALIATAAVLYVELYKIPHDAAVDSFNKAIVQFNSSVSALEDRNKELDDSISALQSVVYAENLPLDEFILLEATSVLEAARSVTRDSAPALPAMPDSTDEINAEAAKILEMIPSVEAMVRIMVRTEATAPISP